MRCNAKLRLPQADDRSFPGAARPHTHAHNYAAHQAAAAQPWQPRTALRICVACVDLRAVENVSVGLVHLLHRTRRIRMDGSRQIHPERSRFLQLPRRQRHHRRRVGHGRQGTMRSFCDQAAHRKILCPRPSRFIDRRIVVVARNVWLIAVPIRVRAIHPSKTCAALDHVKADRISLLDRRHESRPPAPPHR